MKKPVILHFLCICLLLASSIPTGRAIEVPPPAASKKSPPNDTSLLFDIGVLIGRVEQGTSDGAPPASLVPHLVKIRRLASDARAETQFLKEIDALVNAMESAAESRRLRQRIVEFRQKLATGISRPVTVDISKTDALPFDCDQGSWEGVWETTWGDMTLVFDDEGRFHGTYGSSQNALTGKFDPENPKILRGKWTHFGSASPGGIRFEMTAPNRFAGGWSEKIPVDGVGSGWSGTRRKTHHSEILIAPIGEATEVDRSEVTGPVWSQSFLIKRGFSIHGHDVDFPFLQIFTLSPETGEWEQRGPVHLAAEAGLKGTPAGRSFTIRLSLAKGLTQRPILMEFGREAISEKREEGIVTLRTRPLRLVPPTARNVEEKDKVAADPPQAVK